MNPVQATIPTKIFDSAGSYAASATKKSAVVDTEGGAAYIEYRQWIDTDTALTSVTLQESDTLSSSNLGSPTTLYAQVAAVPANTASSGGPFIIGVDMRGNRKRYQQLVWVVPTPGSGKNGALIVCEAEVSRPDTISPAAADRLAANAEYTE